MNINFIAELNDKTFSGVADEKLIEAIDTLTEFIESEILSDFSLNINENFHSNISENFYNSQEGRLFLKILKKDCALDIKEEDFYIKISFIDNKNEKNIIHNSEKLSAYKYYKIKTINDSDIFIAIKDRVFKNLVFSAKLSSAIKTLRNPFRDSNNNIYRHLIALDTKMIELLSEGGLKLGLRNLTQRFYEETSIETSPEASRGDVKSFYINNSYSNLECEPHTKLQSPQNDRIYFNVSEYNENRKVIIGYIGQHL